MTRKWYATLRHPKMHPHTKFGIPTSKNIGDMDRTRKRDGRTDGRTDWRTDGRTDSAITICLPKFLWGHKKTSHFCEFQNDIPCIFLLQIERKPTPVRNLRVIGKIYWHRVSMTSKQTSGQTNRMTYFPRFASNLPSVIFSAYSNCLLVGLLSVLFVVLHFLASIF